MVAQEFIMLLGRVAICNAIVRVRKNEPIKWYGSINDFYTLHYSISGFQKYLEFWRSGVKGLVTSSYMTNL